VSSPVGNYGGPNRDFLEEQIRDLRAQVEALQQRGVRQAGAFTIKAPNGNTIFSSGPYPVFPMPDGSLQWVTSISDYNGIFRFLLWDDNTVTGGFTQMLLLADHLGNHMWRTDPLGGMALPLQPVPGVSEVNGDTGVVYSYAATATNVAEQEIWVGHTRSLCAQIDVNGVWGVSIGTNTTRYRCKVNGITVGFWDVSAGAVISTFGPFDIRTACPIGQIADVGITAQTLSGTGKFACQVQAVHLRGS